MSIITQVQRLLQDNSTQVPLSLFHPLPHSSSPETTLSFVDGGYAELINTGTLLVSFVRVVAISYTGNKKQSIQKKECLMLVWQEDEHYHALCEPALLPTHIFDLHDPTLCFQNQNVTITTVASLLRRLLELDYAAQQTAQCVILDGSLDAKTEYEKPLLKKLGENVIGFSKTCDLTINNQPIPTALLQSTQKTTYETSLFYYQHNQHTIFAKLHPQAQHVFRIDIKKINEHLLNTLATQSTDPLFLGYPFGLILADKLARISTAEKQRRQIELTIQLGPLALHLSQRLAPTNAHTILDTLS